MKTFYEITEEVDRQVLLLSTEEFYASDFSYWRHQLEHNHIPKTLMVYGLREELQRIKKRLQQAKSSPTKFFQSVFCENNLLEISFHASALKTSA